MIGLWDDAPDGAGNVTAGAESTTRFALVPSSTGVADGAAIFPAGTGKGCAGFATGSGVDELTGGGGTCPVAFAGDTTPTTNAIETRPARTIVRGNEDNRDSNRGLEAEEHTNQIQLVG